VVIGYLAAVPAHLPDWLDAVVMVECEVCEVCEDMVDGIGAVRRSGWFDGSLLDRGGGYFCVSSPFQQGGLL